MNIRRIAVACVPALLFVTVGCGDDEERLTEEEFLEQGNAICKVSNDTINTAAEELFGEEEPSTEQIVAFFDDTVEPAITKQLGDLRDLNPPEDLEDDVDALLDDADAALDAASQQAEDDPEAFISLDEDPFKEVNTRATELGLTECGEG